MSYYMLDGLGSYGEFGMAFGDLFYDGGAAYWRVKPGGEIISKIAQVVYGDANKWVDICKANPQDRDPKQPKGDCWYKPGAVLKLPLIPGYPDPASAAPKTGLPVAEAGETIVIGPGKVATIGDQGKVSGGAAQALAKAGMTPGMAIGLGAIGIVAIAALAIMAKKKKGPGAPSTAMTRTA